MPFGVDLYILTLIHISQSRYVLWPEINYKQTFDTHFQGVTENIYNFEDFFLLIYLPSSDISTHPQRSLLVQMMGGRVSA